MKTYLLDQPITSMLKKISKSSQLTLEDSVPLHFYQTMQEQYDIHSTKNIFQAQRKIKYPHEIKNIHAAIKVINKVYKDIESLNNS